MIYRVHTVHVPSRTENYSSGSIFSDWIPTIEEAERYLPAPEHIHPRNPGYFAFIETDTYSDVRKWNGRSWEIVP